MKRIASNLLGALLIALVLGCDEGPPPGPAVLPAPEWNAELEREAQTLAGLLADRKPDESTGLTVRLAFGGTADLDLYVTGPFEESVYYANSPSAIGGALLEDRRCIHDAPRIETTLFARPLQPGRYRIGVDYPRACGEDKALTPFAIAVEAPGGKTASRGLARHQVFEPIVLEFEIAEGDTFRTTRR